MAPISLCALNRSNRLLRKGDKGRAVAELTAAIEASSKDPRLLIQRGLVTGNSDDLRNAVEIAPDHAATHIFLALSALATDDYTTARKEAILCAGIDKGNVSAPALIALLDVIEEKCEPADCITNLLNLSPGVITPVRARSLYEIEKRIASLDPSDTGAKEHDGGLKGPIGWILDRIDDVAVWIYWFLHRAINRVWNFTNEVKRETNRYLLDGMRYEAFGQTEISAEYFRKALLIDPTNHTALEYLTRHHLETGDPDKAEEYLNRLEPEPGEDGSQYTRWRADILFAKNDRSAAAPLYRESTEETKLDYFPPYRLGLCLLETGDKTGAVNAFATALSRVSPRLFEERANKL